MSLLVAGTHIFSSVSCLKVSPIEGEIVLYRIALVEFHLWFYCLDYIKPFFILFGDFLLLL
jgi:hypothetical protein